MRKAGVVLLLVWAALLAALAATELFGIGIPGALDPKQLFLR